MAESASSDRLQPFLLERLMLAVSEESGREKRITYLTPEQLRRSVLEHLICLLNSHRIGSKVDLDRFPGLDTSVLNYGLPSLAGRVVAGLGRELEEAVHGAIVAFEPRIDRESLRVTCVTDVPDEVRHNRLVLEIEGELWNHPTSLHLLLETELDLEKGTFQKPDKRRRTTDA